MECEIDDLALAHGLVQAVRGAWSQREGARRRSVGRGRGEVDLGLHVEAVVFLKVKSVSRLVLVVPSRWCAKEREGCRDANVKKKTAALHACMPPLITASLITCLFFFFFLVAIVGHCLWGRFCPVKAAARSTSLASRRESRYLFKHVLSPSFLSLPSLPSLETRRSSD